MAGTYRSFNQHQIARHWAAADDRPIKKFPAIRLETVEGQPLDGQLRDYAVRGRVTLLFPTVTVLCYLLTV